MMGSNDLSFPVPQARIDGQHILPSSAPVSSLLPPIPSNHSQLLQQHLQASIQAQIAALLHHGTQSVVPPPISIGVPPVNPSHLLAVSAAVGATPTPAVGVPPNPLLSTVDMHGWSVEQIEKQIDVLRQMKQEVPQKMSLLLQDAKKRADKRHAKRIANRQSACTSRARKKALVEEMTALNARLRRQALILSLLPDLVIVIDTEGTITFCSAQVERVLQHNVDDLIGAKLIEIVDPSSKRKLSKLIQGLLRSKETLATTGCQDQGVVSVGQKTLDNRPNDSAPAANKKKDTLENQNVENEDSVNESSGVGANTVTETSFPLSVVQVSQVNATVRNSSDENENSDASHDKQPSSLTANSVAGNSGSDDLADKKPSSNPKNTKTLSKEDTSISQSSDASNTSSHNDSVNAKNLLTANANLERNVRHHNKKIMKEKRAGYKDDVIGAAVTANNASARLSSLQHLKSADSSEEDSGYRQSNDSREESSSSSEGETPSQRNGRRKIIAPTCNVCLIRSDLSTLWCEVTSSLRTKDNDEDTSDNNSLFGEKRTQNSTSFDDNATGKLVSEEASLHGSEEAEPADIVKAVPLVKEILLCLRPIRDGDTKSDETNRFKPRMKAENVVSEDNKSSEAASTSVVDGNTADSNDAGSAVNSWSAKVHGHKRPTKELQQISNKKKRGPNDDDIDSAVVESLMSMSNKKV